MPTSSRSAAETLARRPLEFDDADAIRPASARMYFGRLDASIDDALGPDVHIEIRTSTSRSPSSCVPSGRIASIRRFWRNGRADCR